jgi:hypothetical protein
VSSDRGGRRLRGKSAIRRSRDEGGRA